MDPNGKGRRTKSIYAVYRKYLNAAKDDSPANGKPQMNTQGQSKERPQPNGTPAGKGGSKEKQAKEARKTNQRAIKGSKQTVEKAKRIEEEEKEEFEVVQGARPAICHALNKKKSKLRWKQEEPVERDQLEKAQADGSIIGPNDSDFAIQSAEKKTSNTATAVTKSEMQRIEEQKGVSKEMALAQLKQELEEAKMALQKQTGTTANEQQDIKKLTNSLKMDTNKGKSTEKDEIDEATVTVAVRTLDVIRRNQLLENALGHKETQELRKFFTTKADNPTDQVVFLLVKAMSSAIDMLVSRPLDVEDHIDNQMRALLMNRITAKAILLEVMLSTLAFVPAAWGGKAGTETKTGAVRRKISTQEGNVFGVQEEKTPKR